MKAVGYIRVSSEGQAVDGVSLAAQKSRIELWATSNNYQLIEVFVDAGISGFKTKNRNGLRQALDLACNEKAALVVYSLSRLARSTKDAMSISERLDKAGADLVSLTEKLDTTSACGKMLFRLLAVLAEFERDLVAERTKTALSHLKATGRRYTRLEPYGYELSPDSTAFVEKASEKAAVGLIHSLRESGLSLRKIAEKLEALGIPAKQGGKWSPQAINNIIRAA